MKPYYSDDAVTIYHGDCRDVLPSVEGASVVITDPPFFMPATHYQSRRGRRWQRSWGDASVLGQWWGDTLDHVLPALQTDGALLVFCDGASYPVFYPPTYQRFDSISLIVWDKLNIGMGRPWRKRHELLMHARLPDSYWDETQQGLADVITVRITPSAERLHPIDKPVDLLRTLISPTCPLGGVVLDPFMGGGSTLKAAKDLGRQAIGIETEERYCEIAAKRMAQEVLAL